MIWAVAFWLSGVLFGFAMAGAIPYLWIKQDPRRIGDLVKLILDQFSTSPGSAVFVKLYAALFDTRRASKVFVYATPSDVAEGIRWYIRKCFADPQFQLKFNPGFSDGIGESEKDSGGEAQKIRDLPRGPDA